MTNSRCVELTPPFTRPFQVSVVMAAAPSGSVLEWNRQTLAVWRRPLDFFDAGRKSVLDGSFYGGVKGCVR